MSSCSAKTYLWPSNVSRANSRAAWRTIRPGVPSGIDTICVVVSSADLEGKGDKVVREIKLECRPDQIDVEHGIALIATVGRGMMRTPGIAAKVMSALHKAAVNIRMIDQGSSELNIIVGVREADFENAVNAIYQVFVPR